MACFSIVAKAASSRASWLTCLGFVIYDIFCNKLVKLSFALSPSAQVAVGKNADDFAVRVHGHYATESLSRHFDDHFLHRSILFDNRQFFSGMVQL